MSDAVGVDETAVFDAVTLRVAQKSTDLDSLKPTANATNANTTPVDCKDAQPVRYNIWHRFRQLSFDEIDESAVGKPLRTTASMAAVTSHFPNLSMNVLIDESLFRLFWIDYMDSLVLISYTWH